MTTCAVFRTRILRVTLTTLLLLAALMIGTVGADAPAQALGRQLYLPLLQSSQSTAVADQIVVKLQPGVSVAEINQAYGTTTLRALSPSRGIYLVQAPVGADVARLLRDLAADGRVLYAELNRPTDAPEAIGRLGFAWGGTDNGPYWGQYASSMLDLPAAHAIAQGAGVVVAVIDTGVQMDHPALTGRLTAARADFVDGDAWPNDETGSGYAVGHGTHVAGIVRLVAPQARIMPIRVLDTDGRGYSATVAEAILFALEHGADVINLSLGMPYESELLQDVVAEATGQGVVVVAAAGNLNSPQPQYPAATACVLGVTAVDAARVKASFANYGPWVKLSAPGVGIHSSVPVGGYGVWSGTSMAAPFVAGQAALLRSLNPGLDVVQVADLIGGTAGSLHTANPGYAGQLGAGLIQVAASLQALQNGEIPDLGLLDDDCADD